MAEMTEQQKQATITEARGRFLATLDRQEGQMHTVFLLAVLLAQREADEAAMKLKLDAAMDAFKQGFQLLRDIVDGK